MSRPPAAAEPSPLAADARERPFVAAGDDDALRMPDGADLLGNLHFSPRDGRITFGAERMVLLHVRALGELRRRLIDVLGLAEARALLTRVGFTSGHRDALGAQAIRGDANLYEFLSAGPQMHALEGMVAVTPVELRFDRARGEYYGEFIWRNSAEAEAHTAVAGIGAEPVCWLLLGYASGYTTGFMGRPVIYREIACRGCGARQCRIVGRPLAAWDTIDPPFRFLAEGAASEPAASSAATHATPEPAAAHGLLGAASSFVTAWSLIERVAPTTTPVLLCGEVGTGKSAIAAVIHRLSRGAAGPCVTIGAGHQGPAEVADAHARATGGTLIVDELDAWSEASQRRLLDCMDCMDRGDRNEHRDHGEHNDRSDNNDPCIRMDRSDGGDRTARANEGAPPPRLIVTLLADPSTHGPRLLARLRHRVSAFPIFLPPLRERRDDLERLARHFVGAQAARLGKAIAGLSERALRVLADHEFPGNLHELSARIERAAILVDDGAAIDVGHLFGGEARPSALLGLDRGALRPADPPAPAAPPIDIEALCDEILGSGLGLDEVEQALIRGAVDRAAGNLAAAARSLGLTRPQLAYRFRKGADEDDA